RRPRKQNCQAQSIVSDVMLHIRFLSAELRVMKVAHSVVAVEEVPRNGSRFRLKQERPVKTHFVVHAGRELRLSGSRLPGNEQGQAQCQGYVHRVPEGWISEVELGVIKCCRPLESWHTQVSVLDCSSVAGIETETVFGAHW